LSIQLGLFDVFTYTIPGSLYVALVAYITDRLGWINIASLKDVPTLVLAGVHLIVSYVLGFVADPVAALLDHWLRHWLRPRLGRWLGAWLIRWQRPRLERWLGRLKASDQGDARKIFREQVPGIERRAYSTADLNLLLALAEITQKEAALEISRFRATGLMLRNCGVPFLLGSVASIIEAAAGANLPAAILCALLFGAAVPSCIGQGKRLRQWADLKTLQICYWICYWIPSIDDRIGHSEEGRS
jgi:hypothetical protein